MKTIPIALKTHYKSQRLTTAVLCKATRIDGQIYGFSSVDIDIPYSGLLYSAGALGLSLSATEFGDALAVPNLEVRGILTGDAIQEIDIRAGLWDDAVIEFRAINYRSLTDGDEEVAFGRVGTISTGNIAFVAEFRGKLQRYSQNIGRIVSNQCDAILGDNKCKVDLGPFTATGAIGSVTTSRLFVDSARTEPDHWWRGGNFTVTSGASMGLKMEIKDSQANGTIELVLPMFFGLAIDDTYSMTPGCNHLLKMEDGTYTGDCLVKYDNVLNFQAFPEVPGLDRISQFGGRSTGG